MVPLLQKWYDNSSENTNTELAYAPASPLRDVGTNRMRVGLQGSVPPCSHQSQKGEQAKFPSKNECALCHQGYSVQEGSSGPALRCGALPHCLHPLGECSFESWLLCFPPRFQLTRWQTWLECQAPGSAQTSPSMWPFAKWTSTRTLSRSLFPSLPLSFLVSLYFKVYFLKVGLIL